MPNVRPGVAATERVALEQDHAPGAPAAQLVGDGRPEEPAADHHDVCALAHGRRVSGTRSRGAAVRNGPLIRSAATCPVAEEAMVPSPRDDSLFVPSRTTEHARTFVSWPCRAELWGGYAERGRGGVRGRRRGHRGLRAGDGHRAARRRAAPAGRDDVPGRRRRAPDRRFLGARQRADLRRRRARRRGRRAVRVQRLGRQVRALRGRRAAAGAARRSCSGCASTRRR